MVAAQRFGVGVVLALGMVIMSAPISFALDTVISTPPLIDGPFLITAYSFRGHGLRYLQLSNTGSALASLDGWSLATEWGTADIWQFNGLAGYVEPGQHVTIADESVLPAATFTYDSVTPSDVTRLASIKLVPPVGSGLLDSEVMISIKDTGTAPTLRDSSTTPETFYFQRNHSTSTGNYLSTFTAYDAEPLTIASDDLYAPVVQTMLEIVEIYPSPLMCDPAAVHDPCYEYVKLHNPTTTAIAVSGLRLRTGAATQAASSSNTTLLNGIVLPADGYGTVRVGLSDSGGFAWLEDTYGLNVYENTIVEYPSASGHNGQAWAYSAERGEWRWTTYPTPGNRPSDFGPDVVVNHCEGLRLSEIGANYSSQFIEVYSTAATEIDISGCQLQTNRSTTSTYIFAAGSKMAVGEYRAVTVDATELTLTKTTTGTVYLLNSDGTAEVDARSYDSLDEQTSLALVGGVWKQTFAVTPGSENQYVQYPACESGYTRNEVTGRCNKDPEPVVLAPCPAGQYRNPDTGRCKSLVATTSTLAACAPGEYRNPETNRCKKLVTESSALQPCDPGYERNPDTNRCRKVLAAETTVPFADFPVEPIADTTKAFVAWWALGGALLLGLGYAGWEWRYEVTSWLKRASIRSE